MLLFAKSSFNKLALVLLETSVAKLLVKVVSAFVLLVTSVANPFVKLVSALALIVASFVKAAVPEVVPAST